ncbi:hypothetical protein DSOUD_1062 [Desulfuromonas soudanensis]|uniref:Uncharacterized protein n=1 Tax=Desulfuromonas soudanensis TaxID=1603606 RepID=A0A0M4D561_9BACT|nr:MoaD/ThiS family protein [Desulfuromonas soudanensis]ALC15847.1 hypothetical protein DSOUD_1062 [Desulfuromonas soudanensis]
MEKKANAVIRLYGNLHTLRKERGLPSVAELWLPAGGRTAAEVAAELDLPLERIEGVFCNHKAYGLDRILCPGDELAFIPTGIPGPHRYMLGIHAAGKKHSHE